MEIELNYAWILLFVHGVLAIISAGHALLFKHDPRAALGWIAVCLAYPFIGPIMYYLFGINRLQTRAHSLKGAPIKRLKIGYERSDNPDTNIKNNPSQSLINNVKQPTLKDSFTRSLARSSAAVTHRPLVEHNTLQTFFTGESAYAAMLDAIKQARHSVCMMSYIFDTDHTGRLFINALAAAKKRGVEVRVLLDGIGELYSFPHAGWLLKSRGVKVARFIQPRLIPPSIHINLRNHRKLLIVDASIGFTGGMNIGDRHLSKQKNNRKGISDLHFHLSGPIISQLLEVFYEDWSFATGRESDYSNAHKQPNNIPDNPAAASAICRVVTDGPNEDLGKLTMIISGAVALARKRVLIMTPYFIPPPTLVSALRAASLRGVDVSIILPEKSNQPLAHWATRNMLWELLQFGVHIYYQPAPFSHSKLMLIDEDYAHIGSANIDARSLRLNFEIVVEIFDPEFNAQMSKHFQQIKKLSTEETLSNVDNRSLPVRIRDAIAWLFSPYL